MKYDKDNTRFWVNESPGPEAPADAAAAIVDEELGGEFAYTGVDAAHKIVAKLNELVFVNQRPSQMWAMVQINDGKKTVTEWPTEDDAYNDIIETTMNDLNWLQLSDDDKESGKLKEMQAAVDRMPPKDFYTKYLDDTLGSWRQQFAMYVVPLHIPPVEKEKPLVRCMIVSCVNSNGSPDFYFCKVSGNQAQFEDGYFYETAVNAAEKAGYGLPMLAFDEDDQAGKAILDVFHWETASTFHVPRSK